MSFDSLLTWEITVSRPVKQGSLDDHGHEVVADQVMFTAPALIQELSARERAAFHEGGPTATSHKIFVRPGDYRVTDSVEDQAGRRYEITSIVDAGGRGHHLELGAKSLLAPEVSEGS